MKYHSHGNQISQSGGGNTTVNPEFTQVKPTFSGSDPIYGIKPMYGVSGYVLSNTTKNNPIYGVKSVYGVFGQGNFDRTKRHKFRLSRRVSCYGQIDLFSMIIKSNLVLLILLGFALTFVKAQPDDSGLTLHSELEVDNVATMQFENRNEFVVPTLVEGHNYLHFFKVENWGGVAQILGVNPLVSQVRAYAIENVRKLNDKYVTVISSRADKTYTVSYNSIGGLSPEKLLIEQKIKLHDEYRFVGPNPTDSSNDGYNYLLLFRTSEWSTVRELGYQPLVSNVEEYATAHIDALYEGLVTATKTKETQSYKVNLVDACGSTPYQLLVERVTKLKRNYRFIGPDPIMHVPVSLSVRVLPNYLTLFDTNYRDLVYRSLGNDPLVREVVSYALNNSQNLSANRVLLRRNRRTYTVTETNSGGLTPYALLIEDQLSIIKEFKFSNNMSDE